MRKHSIRKFIHAILDLLPLMVIPIFAIYSQNHEINDNSITINESYWEVQNKYETNEINTINDLQINKLYHYDELTFDYDNIDGIDIQLCIVHCETTNFNYGNSSPSFDDQYLDYFNANTNNVILFSANYHDCYVMFTNLDSFATLYYDDFTDITFEDIDFYFDNVYAIEQFDILITNSLIGLPHSSDFNVLEYIYHENTSVVYNDTDIMSQFMYVTYNAVDKYFNMNNVFNLGGIWNWVSNTLFGGQPPISAFIVYNVIAYEFIMDVIFLLYTVFMFILDFAENCLEKPFNKIRRS